MTTPAGSVRSWKSRRDHDVRRTGAHQVTSIEASLPQLTAYLTRASVDAMLLAYKSDLASITFHGLEDVELTRAWEGGQRIRNELVLPVLRVVDLSAQMQPLLSEQFTNLWQASGWADGSPSIS